MRDEKFDTLLARKVNYKARVFYNFNKIPLSVTRCGEVPIICFNLNFSHTFNNYIFLTTIFSFYSRLIHWDLIDSFLRESANFIFLILKSKKWDFEDQY